MRVLALGPESFGGFAGMAQGTRDYLSGLLTTPEVDEVLLLARNPPSESFARPDGLSEECLPGNPARYAVEAFRRQARERFDLVVCVHVNLMPVAAALKAAFGVPVWLMVHGIDAWEPRGPLRRRSVARADLVTASSRYTRERFLAWSGVDPARAVVLNNPFHPERFRPGEKPEYLLERYGLRGRKVLLTLGSMLGGDRFKGHNEILDALPALCESHPELAWLVVGGGADRARIEARVAASDVADRVTFAGRIPEEEKRDHYLVADAFALPSCTEGFGIVYLEAAACGLPVLGSVRDGSRDPLCDGELGVLVDPRDPADLLRGLEELLQRERRVPPELERFTFERLAERMRALVARFFPEERRRAA